MIYSATTPPEEVPYYCLPELGGYFMSKGEQREARETLESEIRDLRKEAASLADKIMAASVPFDRLSRLLKNNQVGNEDWSIYQKLVDELPHQAARYEELKQDLARLQARLDKLTALD